MLLEKVILHKEESVKDILPKTILKTVPKSITTMIKDIAMMMIYTKMTSIAISTNKKPTSDSKCINKDTKIIEMENQEIWGSGKEQMLGIEDSDSEDEKLETDTQQDSLSDKN